MKLILLFIISFYRRYLSFDRGILKIFAPGGACRFTPTCSEYMYIAIDRYGIIVGLWYGIVRIIRCNPWNKGGYDPVPENVSTNQSVKASKNKH